jgi:hypothetical protein
MLVVQKGDSMKMNYIWIVGKSFGNIPYNITKESLPELLGEPSDILEEEIIDDAGQKMVSYDYEYIDLGISLEFLYFDEEYYSCTLMTDKLIINGNDIYKLKKRKVLELIKKIFDTLQLKYQPKKEYLYVTNEYIYSFENIGLTIIFKNTKISNILIKLNKNE